jgi:hypothetical protein
MFYSPVLVFGSTEGVGSRFHDLCVGLVFGGTEGVGSHFHILRSLTRFRWYRGRRVRLHILRARNRFRLYRGRRVAFSCFALPDSFLMVPRALGPVSIFSVAGLIFGGTKGDGSRFHVLRSRTCFRRCQVHRVTFS